LAGFLDFGFDGSSVIGVSGLSEIVES